VCFLFNQLFAHPRQVCACRCLSSIITLTMAFACAYVIMSRDTCRSFSAILVSMPSPSSATVAKDSRASPTPPRKLAHGVPSLMPLNPVVVASAPLASTQPNWLKRRVWIAVLERLPPRPARRRVKRAPLAWRLCRRVRLSALNVTSVQTSSQPSPLLEPSAPLNATIVHQAQLVSMVRVSHCGMPFSFLIFVLCFSMHAIASSHMCE
jgi:hypothetical protein